jgi:hypothetical protein
MEVMGSFIETSIPRIKKFYDHLREVANISDQSNIYDRDVQVPPEVLLNGLAAPQAVLASEKDKIKAWAPNSHLDTLEQGELVQIIDECLVANSSAPRKSKRATASEGEASLRKRK